MAAFSAVGWRKRGEAMATEHNQPLRAPKRKLRLVGQLRAAELGAGLPSRDVGIWAGPPLPPYEWDEGIDPDTLGVPCRVDPLTGALIPLA